MKIEKNEMKKISKVLKGIKYEPQFGEYLICFPIEMKREKDIDGIQLDLVDNKSGSEKMPEPAFALQYEVDEKQKIHTVTKLVFADFTFARKFDFIMYCDLLDERLSKKEIDILDKLDCYLVSEKNILTGFAY